MYSPNVRIGDQIRRYRKTNGNRSQAAIAGLCGISVRYMSMIENNQRTPAPDLLSRFAVVLGVPVALLLSENATPKPKRFNSVTNDVSRALFGHVTAQNDTAPSPAELRLRVERAWLSWQTSQARFTEAERDLPPLIADVDCALHQVPSASDPRARRENLRMAADLYGLLRSYCRRAGRPDLSAIVADRAIRAADDADDPVLMATARWNMGHVLLSDPREEAAEEAEEIALTAIEQIRKERSGPELTAMQGALELVAAVSEARRREWWKARNRLEKNAGVLAARTGESNVGRTVFGPTNVQLHRLSIEMLAGESAEALRLADQVDAQDLPSRERQFTFGLDVACCYDMRREDPAVFVHLLNLEELAPEDLARSPQALALVRGLLKRVRPTYRRQVTDLADRLGLS
ncbi:helix-turn-helix domain-containing protein [Streptomyces niveus]|uniref:helix-turn-helix domain-containing protein n=1 Tax=Streptomyces niveus TaxID=193462 RepID=UPI0036506F68